MKKSILFLIVILLSACQSAPQVTVTPEVPVTLTSLSTEIPSPAPTPSLIPTPTPIAFSSNQLVEMTDEEKIAAGAEAVADHLGGTVVVNAELRGNEYWTFKTEKYINENQVEAERTVVAGVYNLETGEWTPRLSALEVWEMFKGGEQLPDTFVFDGEIVEKGFDAEHALGRAQEATYKGVEYAAGVDVWKNAGGEIVLVDWPYYPGGAHDLMSVASTPDGRLVVMQPAGTEVKYDLSGISASELDQIYKVLLQGDNNPDLESILRDPEGRVIVVLGLQSTTSTYWSGDEAEKPESTLMELNTPAKIKLYTADLRGPGVVVATNLYTNLLFSGNRSSLTSEKFSTRGYCVSEGLASADQSPTSTRGDGFEGNYVNPRDQVIKMLSDAGIILRFFE